MPTEIPPDFVPAAWAAGLAAALVLALLGLRDWPASPTAVFDLAWFPPALAGGYACLWCLWARWVRAWRDAVGDPEKIGTPHGSVAILLVCGGLVVLFLLLGYYSRRCDEVAARWRAR